MPVNSKMYTCNRTFLVIASISGFLTVAFGAFAAHGLKAILSESLLQTFHTGVQYQAIHTLALVFVAMLPGQNNWLLTAGFSFIAGISLFSGSLYLLSVSGIGWFGYITPFGGVCFLLGWASLVIFAWKTPAQ